MIVIIVGVQVRIQPLCNRHIDTHRNTNVLAYTYVTLSYNGCISSLLVKYFREHVSCFTIVQCCGENAFECVVNLYIIRILWLEVWITTAICVYVNKEQKRVKVFISRPFDTSAQ